MKLGAAFWLVVVQEGPRRFRWRAKGAARVYGRFQFTEGWSKCESGKQRFTARVAGRLRGAG